MTKSKQLTLFSTLRAKLIAAFSAVMITLAVIGFISYFALKMASDGFKDYRELARDSNLAGILQSNMLMVRMNVKDFLLTGSEKDIRQYNEYFTQVETLLKDATREINKPERAEMVKQLTTKIATYNETFDLIKAYRVQRNDLVFNKLNVIGPQMERELTKLMFSASESNDTQLAYLTGVAMRNLLLGRLYVIKYLESNDESADQRVKQEFSAFEQQMDLIEQLTNTAANRELIAQVRALEADYKQAYLSVHDIIVARNDKVINTLDVLGPRFAKLVDDLKLSVKTDQDKLGPMLKEANESAVTNIMMTFAVALLLSGCIVFILTRNVMAQLGKDPSELENVARAIARGDLDEQYDERAPKGVFKSMMGMRDSLRQIREKEKEEKRIASTNARIKSALDNASACVMITNTQNQVIYLNDAIYAMFDTASSDICTVHAHFDSKGILNQSLSQSLPDFAEFEQKAQGLSDSYANELKIAGRTFAVVASPVVVEGKTVGLVYEWEDKTQWLANEAEKARVASENARVKYALDGSSGQVMITDDNYKVIYLNGALEQMFKEASADVTRELTDFNSANIKHNALDYYFSHFTNLLAEFDGLTTSHQSEFVIAGRTFNVVASPVKVDGERVGTVLEWQDKTQWLALEREKSRVASENARVKYALDSVSGNVMIADPDLNVIYANNALQNMMLDSEQDIRQHVGAFESTNLMGFAIHNFYLEPEQQKLVFENLDDTHRSVEHIGNKVFALTANPIEVDGKRIGTVLEWVDRTAEVNIEKEIDDIVQAASQGDLSKKIDPTGKSGFFGNLSQGLNDLLGTVEVALDDVMQTLGALAHGDLTTRITNEYQGKFGKLKGDTNATADKLTEIISSIRSSAGSISQSANEIAQGNMDLSQRTEEQASSLEETSASMDAMTDSVKQSSKRAENANELSLDAERRAEQGGQVVNMAVTAMKEISDSSKEISEIIGVIDEIAFQTNLLALNAAVEAARAGEQGRGFAVVAGEVRNLAQRSSEAAKEIKDLIRDSQTKVEEGTSLVNKSGETLLEIVEATSKVRVMMQDLAESSRQQSEGIVQVNSAVTQMDEMTQQNAALVEQATAAGQSMADQANSMNSTMDFFTIEQRSTGLRTLAS
ncbi:methyl-accepting chemotaxis protein [Pseudoalteromonas luteoviolacea]|uniref:methyl-accepting chemotaxis protein n=1 Tax=Pseudoalteromonas luteoviolacea TaxID=43657 RepID=UPI001EEF5F78|nr:methyl-accepting chemotaxis protein [Pseudoalteromonas luteoviolacea]MCF6438755.1 methyl-accepting chemotaxis protein [Pseudoalteromonas luteoviolacea]